DAWFGVAKAINGLVYVANPKERIFAANQVDQALLLLVDVLILVEHNLAEALADTLADRCIVAQKLDCAVFEGSEIQPGQGRFLFRVQRYETFEDVEDERAVWRDSGVQQRFFESDEPLIAESPDGFTVRAGDAPKIGLFAKHSFFGAFSFDALQP